EAPLDRASMEEPLLSPFVADEAKAPVSNEPLDSATRHSSLLEHVHAPKGRWISSFVPVRLLMNFVSLRPSRKPGRCELRKRIRTRVYFTVTVIIWQAPGSVLCRSSPSWSARRCLPGVSCISISSLPSPKWTHDGVPLTMFLPAGRQ